MQIISKGDRFLHPFHHEALLNSHGPLSVTHTHTRARAKAAFEVALSRLLDVPHFHFQTQKNNLY